MWITRVSIARPVFAVMVMFALCVLGVFSYIKLGVEQLPDLNLPVAYVDVLYPGASPQSVEEEITKRVEEALNGIAGVKRITSRSFEGRSQTAVEFNLNANMARGMQDVRDKIAAIQAAFPKDAKTPLVLRVNNESSEPVAVIGLLSSSKSHRDLSMLAELQVVRRLQRIDGVAFINISGNATREIRIDLNQQKLRAHSVLPSDISAALRNQNQDAPIGLISNDTQDGILRMEGRATNYLDLNAVVVQQRNAFPVAVGDLGHLYMREREFDSLARINTQRAISIEVFKQQDANIVSTGEGVKQALEELKKQLPSDIELRVINLSSDGVKDSLVGVQRTLIEGALLTVAIVLLFLKSWRSTVITGLTLPIAVVSSFIAVQAFGFTLNFMTMMALSLCIGLLVDDAIVVRENIVRHLAMGKSHMDAAREGTEEIGLAVLATTFAICAVFVPMAFMDGIVGRLFFPFGITVVVAVIISLLVSFTLDPMLSSVWAEPKDASLLKVPVLGFLIRRVDRFMALSHALYEKLIHWIFAESKWVWGRWIKVSHRALVLGLAALSLLVAFALASVVGTEFIPQTDRGLIQITMRLPVGSSLPRSSEKLKQVEEAIRTLPEVTTMVTVIGGSDAGFLVGRNQAALNIVLKPRAERARSQKQIEDAMRKLTAPISGIEVTIGMDRPIYIAVLGNDAQRLAEFSQSFAEKIKTIPGIVDVDLSVKPGLTAYSVKLDDLAARELGLNASQVGAALRAYINGEIATTWLAGDGEQIQVVLRLPQADRQQLAQIGKLPVAFSKDGQAIELSRVAKIEPTANPEVIRRQNLMRREAIFAGVQGRPSGDVGQQVQDMMKATALPEGIYFDLGGSTKDQKDAFSAITSAMLMAVLFIYIVLASQFNSFKQPIAIMASLPLAMIGVMLALLITGTTLNLFSMIGMVMLMGLVTKNAILLLDFANGARLRGLKVKEALLEAGQVRMRPIMMTTFAMIFGMLPLALALNEGGELQAGMGRAIIGGVITSALLTLVVVPVIYSYLIKDEPAP
ncbi:MAG: efflux RND transporter permease subunit [Betaproteobacteria bacterium]|jgi:hydrophobe/amphiphile efflux-1 (HAE1) family protein|nr:efflux RND transporter permease subunit [Burkholderiales bacterium]NBX13896.1 efflux RND transporter permease subunit [Betaproteobacteria bacterium]NBX90149.1 efflux RND transporter permease subunit [Betaproteobacteria bacterium]